MWDLFGTLRKFNNADGSNLGAANTLFSGYAVAFYAKMGGIFFRRIIRLAINMNLTWLTIS